MEAISEHEMKTRFDARLSKDKKLIIEKAAILGGYRSLSGFFILNSLRKGSSDTSTI